MTRISFKTLGAVLGAVAALGAAGAASALTLGPALDFLQWVSPDDASPLYATAWAPPLPGVEQPALRGQVRITLAPGTAPVPMIGIGYLSSSSGQFDSGNVVFTSIFGISAAAIAAPYPDNPWSPLPLPANTGTSLGHEEPRLIGPYTVFGASGTAYAAGTALQLRLADLPAVLGSDFDLTPFAGNPSGVFYVFQAEIPASELLSAVPEPGSALLLAGGLALLARRAARKNRCARISHAGQQQGSRARSGPT